METNTCKQYRMNQLSFALYGESDTGRKAGIAKLIFLYIVVSVLLNACATRYQLANTRPSIDEIGQKVLAAVQKNDYKELDAMRITEQEFRELIFPGLPIGKIEQWKKNYDFVWGDVNTKSNYGLRAVLARYGGQKFSYVKTIFKKGVTTYELQSTFPFWKQSYTAHEDARIIAKDDKGEESELKLFGAIIEYRGKYKIMSFNISNK
jgi:hypothetical protein